MHCRIRQGIEVYGYEWKQITVELGLRRKWLFDAVVLMWY